MSLAEQQRLLARLYTDPEIRRQLDEDPAALAAGLGVEGATAENLTAVADEIDEFAQALHRKRFGSIRKALPATSKALGKRFREAFIEHAEVFIPSGTDKIRRDILAFERFLDERLTGEDVWIRELLRWEAAWVRANDPRFRFRMLFFRSAEAAQARGAPESWRPEVIVWWRLPGKRLRYRALRWFF